MRVSLESRNGIKLTHKKVRDSMLIYHSNRIIFYIVFLSHEIQLKFKITVKASLHMKIDHVDLHQFD